MQNYWDKVYSEKTENEMSWFQEHPTKSLELITKACPDKHSAIIDIGGGDSRLVDHLLNEGYTDITVLDVSEASLNKLKSRLGDTAGKVKYLVTDITAFRPPRIYDLWHDRAAFHFLTEQGQVDQYLDIVNTALSRDGHLIISTFSKEGPEKCSGLPVHQYSDLELKKLFKGNFVNIECFEDSHVTPWGKTQSFVYCEFKKK